MHNQQQRSRDDPATVVERFLRLWTTSQPLSALNHSRDEGLVKVEPLTEAFVETGANGKTERGKCLVDEAATGIGLGTIVFAPYRRKAAPTIAGAAAVQGLPGGSPSCSSPSPSSASMVECHYGLAEVTGLQSSAGTATVAFLFADPGVDDEAVSLFDLVPCPPSWLHKTILPLTSAATPLLPSSMKAVSPACSLLEKVMGWPMHDGPLDASRALASLKEDGSLSSLYCLGYCRHQQQQPVQGAEQEVREGSGALALSLPPRLKVEEAPQKESTAAITSTTAVSPAIGSSSSTLVFVFHSEATSIHTFYANSFRHIDRAVQQQQQAAATAGAVQSASSYSSNWGSTPPPPTMLCVFDRYDVLRRFEAYFTVRGHLVKLLDGEDPAPSSEGDDRWECNVGSFAAPPTRLLPPICEAFGSTCKVWLCMLRDDALEARGVESLLRPYWSQEASIERLLLFHCTESGDGEKEGKREMGAETAATPGSSEEDSETAKHAILQYLRAQRSATAEPVQAGRRRGKDNEDSECVVLTVAYEQVPPEDVDAPLVAAAAAAATAPSAPSLNGGSGSRVKVAGTVFGERKLLVPASREQLLLMQTVRQSSKRALKVAKTVTAAGGRRLGAERAPAEKEEAPATAMSPALLERIALGNFTDSAAANLFEAYKGTMGFLSPVSVTLALTEGGSSAVAAAVGGSHRKRERGQSADDNAAALSLASASAASVEVFARIDDLRHKFCDDGSRFGEAFPVFAAAAAIVRDVLRSASSVGEVPFRLPRVALVFPRGNPSGSPLLQTRQFTAALAQLVAPLAVYELGGGPCLPPSVLWWRRGGLLLLHSDEASTRFTALHESASVVVACGKAAAAWVAANAVRPTCFAVLSEVEVVPAAQQERHLWVPFTPSVDAHDGSGSSSSSSEGGDAEKGGHDDALAWLPTALDETAPKVLQQAVALHRYLASVESLSSGGVDGGGGNSNNNHHHHHRELAAFVKAMARNIAQATPLCLCELLVQP